MTLSWTNIQVRLGDLRAWSDNPRLSTKKQAERLLKSFDEFGQVQTIAVSPDLDVYDGHQRLSALLTIHGKDYTVDARQSSRALTDEERRKLVIYLHSGAVGSWDWDALSGWNAQEVIGWGMDDAVLKDWKRDVTALGALIEAEKPPVEDVEPQIDRAEELREKWGVESGQLWQLGEHRLICGDCTDRAVVESVMGGKKASICFTSPPYNAGVSAQLSGNTNIGDNLYKDEYDDNKSQPDYFDLLMNFTDLSLDVCQYVFVNIQVLSGNKRAFVDYWHHYSDQFCDVAVWDKCHAAPAQAQRVMDSRFEFVLIFGGNGSRAIGTREFRGMVHNVYSGNPQRHNENASIHAATFPVDFPVYFITNFTNDNEIIYEPFCGTGTTLIACENLGRKCRAIEISPAYVAVALQRWADLTGKTPELVTQVETG